MGVKALTNDDYKKLAALLDMAAMDAPQQLKQAHRLLCEGREVETLTVSEQFYATAFKDAVCVQVPNDYGWEPGVEVAEKAEAKAEKPKKNGK